MRLIHLRRAAVWLAALALTAGLLAGCSRERIHQQESYVFGTRVEVLTWDASEDKSRAAVAEVLREFDRLHRAYHAWEPSELTALNQAIAAGQQGIPVSPELAAMLTEAKAIAATGDELFDPALGSKNGTPWSVGIQHPRQPGPLATLQLRDGEAIGTSGDYQRYFELDGERYCHLLDPRTGRPARGTQAVTILITPRPAGGPQAGTLSDAASKPIYLGGEHWRDYAKRFGIEHALRVDADGKVEVTPALHSRLQYGDGIKPAIVVN